MLYIVHIAIDDEIADEWWTWMEEVHIPDVMDTGCFEEAIAARDLDEDMDGRQGWRVLYVARGQADLERYLNEHAQALQAEHNDRFADHQFEAWRETLPIAQRYFDEA